MMSWKQWVPAWLKQCYRGSGSGVVHRSSTHNVYHCTVQKSASQWLRAILADERTYRYCGLPCLQYEEQLPGGHDPRKLTARRFTTAFPTATILTPIYIDYPGFALLPKPARYKAFFVMRDPRDVVVSWYYSLKCSHVLLGEIGRIRQDLANLSETDGLLYAIDFLADYGLFAAQRSWAGGSAKDPNVLLVRFEELTVIDNAPLFEQILAHCDIRLPRTVLEEVLQSYTFEKLSGRKPGQEDPTAHYRKGMAGDWRNHFNDRVEARFMEAAGEVLRMWNYS